MRRRRKLPPLPHPPEGLMFDLFSNNLILVEAMELMARESIEYNPHDGGDRDGDYYLADELKAKRRAARLQK